MVKVSDILPSFQNGKRQELFSTLAKALFDNVKCMIRQGRMHDSVQVPLQACVAGLDHFFDYKEEMVKNPDIHYPGELVCVLLSD